MKNLHESIRFITLSGYSDADYIEAMVLRHHEKWTSRYAKWSYESTKQKINVQLPDLDSTLTFF